MGIRKLAELLRKKFGQNVVSNPSTNPHKSHNYKINIKILCDGLQDTKIKNWSQKHWNDKNAIKTDEFIGFIEKEINNNNTKGFYQEYMDFIHAFYDVPIVNLIPQYNKVKDDIKERIMPKRKEYFYAWWIGQKIKTDVFFKQLNQEIKSKYLEPTYQESIRKGDNRFYDILFRALGIIIEIQEDSKSHDECLNDLTKEGLCTLRGFRIKYFKLQEVDSRNLDYLEEFWNGNNFADETENFLTKEYGLKDMILQGLFSICEHNSRELIYKEYITHNYIQYQKIKYYDLEKNIKYYTDNKKQLKDKLYKQRNEFNHNLKDKLEVVIDDDSNSTEKEYIKIMNNWYKSSHDIDQYTINPFDNDFMKIMMFNSNKREKFLELCWIGEYCGISNSNYYNSEFNYNYDELRFSWNRFRRLLIDLKTQKLEESDKNSQIIKDIKELIKFDNGIFNEYCSHVIDLMMIVEKTYSLINKSIITHNEIRLNTNNKLMDLIEKHIHNKTTSKYQTEIEKLTDKLDITEKELSNYEKTAKTLVRKVNTLLKYIKPTMKSNEKNKKQYNTVCGQVNELEKLIGLNQNKFTIQFINGISLIKELESFPIIYTGLITDKIEKNDLKAICNNFNIPTNIFNEIIRNLTGGLNNFISDKKSTLLCGVILVEQKSESESESESKLLIKRKQCAKNNIYSKNIKNNEKYEIKSDSGSDSNSELSDNSIYKN